MNVVNLDEYKLMHGCFDCNLENESYKQSYFLDCARTGLPAGEFINQANIESVTKIISSYFNCLEKQITQGDVFRLDEDVQEVLAWIIYDDSVMDLIEENLRNHFMNSLKAIIEISDAVRVAEKLFDMMTYGNIKKMQDAIIKRIVRINNNRNGIIDKQVKVDRVVLKSFALLIVRANNEGLISDHSKVFLYWFLSKCKGELSQYFYVGFTEHRDLVQEITRAIESLDMQLTWDNNLFKESVNDDENLHAQLALVKS